MDNRRAIKYLTVKKVIRRPLKFHVNDLKLQFLKPQTLTSQKLLLTVRHQALVMKSPKKTLARVRI
ncbi:hypothetical protein DNTS_030118 [Danionella cerebrum]|uniref:Uncharacterized protein n=1 Tax=Danionella cerebrum TaxID=2873325 RepID=A0A553RGF9_9TELE|nr:hypothetical protein DNTS_030118 [Danionella translucida]TRZ01274.1 hypothetical protein DNTS_030118 [Danionella translucida]